VESLLAGGVPNLELDFVRPERDRFDLLELESEETKSTPIVLKYFSAKVSSQNRCRRLLLPTPELPIRTISDIKKRTD
jgi:hypothetical protein